MLRDGLCKRNSYIDNLILWENLKNIEEWLLENIRVHHKLIAHRNKPIWRQNLIRMGKNWFAYKNNYVCLWLNLVEKEKARILSTTHPKNMSDVSFSLAN